MNYKIPKSVENKGIKELQKKGREKISMQNTNKTKKMTLDKVVKKKKKKKKKRI